MTHRIHSTVMAPACYKEQIKLVMPRNLSYISNLYQEVQLAEGFSSSGTSVGSSREGQHGPRRLFPTSPALPRNPPTCDPNLRPIIRRRARSLPSSPERRNLARCHPQNRCCQRVRFADALGLELAEVKVFNAGEDPLIPLHVLSRLSINSDLCCGSSLDLEFNIQYLQPDFPQPADCVDFPERLRQQCICLERVIGGSEELGISGTILVLNLDFHKAVYVRYTLNEWRTHQELEATWQQSRKEPAVGDCDLFTFSLPVPPFLLQLCPAVQLALHYKVGGKEYWDNHQGKNYSFSCQSHALKIPKDSGQSWIHFI
ncbi:protein phosphatase 1 regulatory subunit 3D [Ambystoma mexicanum]|uniref:protein phosphatase 1 regulatory subunit 3D n=1 Tax=Ambystoma mexicanum TaxID=8296 RepID=UPI0037E9B67F